MNIDGKYTRESTDRGPRPLPPPSPCVPFPIPTAHLRARTTRAAYTKQRLPHPHAEVFEAVQRGDADFGVVPFENSTNGPVIFTLDNLANRFGTCPDISVCGEAYVDVHHYLLGHKSRAAASLVDDSGGGSGAATPTASDPNPLRPRTKPLSGLRHVQRLYSHPQAWGQCSVFLSTYLRGVETIDVSSTSRAAEMVKEDPSGCSAAISSEIAARVYGLDILAKCIEDREDNTTRFFILRRTSRAGLKVPAPTPAPGPGARGTKSLVSFTVPHREPGALADVLDCFRKKGLNLTSINSRPSLMEAFQYLFFVEIEGHYDLDAGVREAYEAVQGVAQTSRWLGSWYSRRS